VSGSHSELRRGGDRRLDLRDRRPELTRHGLRGAVGPVGLERRGVVDALGHDRDRGLRESFNSSERGEVVMRELTIDGRGLERR
jgi:hypothetical protein